MTPQRGRQREDSVEIRFGHYQVLSAIGAGSMGEVYLALDTNLGRHVALKVLPARFAGVRARVERFLCEAKAASALNHPNIVTVYDSGEDHGEWFIAAEFIDGMTLRRRMAAGKFTVAEALDIILQCAAALDAAHSAGILHRDIKPENIMVRPDGVVKIVDFGVARIADPSLQPGEMETQPGAIVGTPRYMSPEQARGAGGDAASDVFSLGSVLYELIAGRPAFPGATTADVLAALLTTDPEPLSAHRVDLPPGLDRVIARALAKRCPERYRTMGEFSADILALRQSNPAPRRKRVVAYAVVVMAVAAAIWLAGRIGLAPQKPPHVVPLTTFSGFKDFPALSPDRRRLAFAWNGGRGGAGGKLERQIYVMPVGGGEPVRLTDSAEDNRWPVWSPDGRQIAFTRRVRGRENAVYILPASGGPERHIAFGGYGVSWSPDGTTLALSRSDWPTEVAGIFLVDVRTGAQRELTDPKSSYDTFPAFSPDGRWLAFTRGETDHQRGVWVIPAVGGTAHELKPAEKKIFGLTWTADSNEIIFSTQADRAGNSLYRVSLDGGRPKLLNLPTDDSTYPQIPAAGGALVYTLSFVDTNIYRGSHTQLIVSPREDHSASFSPQGDRIAFISSRSGAPEVWIARRDGSAPMQLTRMNSSSLGSPRWSPDGRRIAFDCHTLANTDIFVVAADGGVPRRLTDHPAGDILPSWAVDGQWLIFTSDRSGSIQLWKIPAAGGEAIPVTRGGARESWPSPDGKQIYFTRTRPEGTIWSIPVEGGLEEPVPELKRYDRVARSWGVVRNGIYFISREEGLRQQVRFLDFATRRVTTLATLAKEPIWNVPAVALSPDGRDLLTAHVDH